MLVHDPALLGTHRLQFDDTAIPQHRLSGLIRGRSQNARPALAIPGRVDHETLTLLAAVKDDAVCEMLDRVDRLSMVADQQPEILTGEFGHHALCVL